MCARPASRLLECAGHVEIPHRHLQTHAYVLVLLSQKHAYVRKHAYVGACSRKSMPCARARACPRHGTLWRSLSGEHLVEATALDCAERLGEAAEQLLAYEHLREGHHAGAPSELDASGQILGEIDL
jgi:hypothetical protein